MPTPVGYRRNYLAISVESLAALADFGALQLLQALVRKSPQPLASWAQEAARLEEHGMVSCERDKVYLTVPTLTESQAWGLSGRKRGAKIAEYDEAHGLLHWGGSKCLELHPVLRSDVPDCGLRFARWLQSRGHRAPQPDALEREMLAMADLLDRGADPEAIAKMLDAAIMGRWSGFSGGIEILSTRVLVPAWDVWANEEEAEP